MKIFNVTWTKTIHFLNGEVGTFHEEDWGYALESYSRSDGSEQLRLSKDGYFEWIDLTDKNGKSLIEDLKITLGDE